MNRQRITLTNDGVNIKILPEVRNLCKARAAELGIPMSQFVNAVLTNYMKKNQEDN